MSLAKYKCKTNINTTANRNTITNMIQIQIKIQFARLLIYKYDKNAKNNQFL